MEDKGKNNDKKNKKKIIFGIVFWIVIVLFILIFSIIYVQPSVFFYPWHDLKSYESLKEIDGFEEIKIENGKNIISGWVKFNKDKNEKSPLLIMYGGNAQNSSNTCYWFYEDEIFSRFKEYNFLIVDYPSYGLSTGYLSEKTMFDTAIKAYEYAEKQTFVDTDKIVVLGFSIGTGVANYVASEKLSHGLIVVAPYDRALSLYNNAINIFHGPMKLLTRYKFDSISYAEKIITNPLVITSKDDEVISYKLTENLVKFYKNSPEYMCIDGALHNDYFLRDEVLDKIEEYLQSKEKEENR